MSKEFEKIPIIIRSKPNKYQKELLKIFKIKNKIITTNKKDIFIKDLYFPSLPSPPIYDLDTINWIREIFLNHQIKKSSFPSSKRIYISREDASHRKVRNCSKIYAYLKDLGFTKHILSKISIDEQIELFKNAEIVVMPHGSNCLHMVYAPKKCKFIEFQSPSQINNIFACMSLILKQKYGFLIGKNDNVEKLLKVTHIQCLKYSKIIILKIIKNVDYIKILIQKFRNTSWSKKIYNKKYLEKFYEIKIDKKTHDKMYKKIKATYYKDFKPFILINKKKYYINEKR